MCGRCGLPGLPFSAFRNCQRTSRKSLPSDTQKRWLWIHYLRVVCAVHELQPKYRGLLFAYRRSRSVQRHKSSINDPTYRVQTRRGKLHIPNYSAITNHPFYSLDADSGHQTNNFGAQSNASASVRSALPRLPRIPKNPTVQSSGSFATEHPPFHFGPRMVSLSEGALDTGIGGRCHSGISMAIHQNVPIASRCGCMAPRQLSGSKRLKSRFAFFPSQSPAICVPFTGMQPSGIECVGITQLQEHGIPLKDSNVVDGRAPSSGENSGSSLGPDNGSSGVSLNPFGPSLGGAILPPWHRCGPDSAAQPSAETPPPPAPLTPNTTCNEYKSAWNAGFFSGCVFATRASGESSSDGSRSQSDPTGSMARVSPCPYPVNFQRKEHEAEWFAGFVAGCEFATRTSKGPESGPFPSQADLAEATRRDAPSASSSPEIHNGIAPTQQGIGLNITVAQTPPVNLENLGGHGVQTANNLTHGQPCPHTPSLTRNSGLNDGNSDFVNCMRSY
ncbi:unnamed protein product [Rhizoctonia solani]|uniref:Uncharacterized protein n=1 Tax=Rhizoctonia solani TaxID=456999 RepID=A0A8H3HD17_9AGAM|nr:unnamed protein product [Rhizoctonia solani]CAE6519955.1 unnamed protein product [Rhizoctonia solani]